MREYSTPPTSTSPPTGNLTDDLLRHAADDPDRVAVSRRGPSGWSGVTSAQLLAEVRRTAKGLVAAGIAPGDRVALVSKTRYEWTLLDYAIWYAGAVTVPVYETTGADQVGWILADSGATAVVAARLGLGCVLGLRGTAPETPDGNLFLATLFGARAVFVAPEAVDSPDALFVQLAEEVRRTGGRPWSRAKRSRVWAPESRGKSARSPGRYPIRARSSAPPARTSSPSTSARPRSGRSRSRSSRIVVVLPAPFGPRKPKISPRGTVRSRSTTPGVAP